MYKVGHLLLVIQLKRSGITKFLLMSFYVVFLGNIFVILMKYKCYNQLKYFCLNVIFNLNTLTR